MNFHLNAGLVLKYPLKAKPGREPILNRRRGFRVNSVTAALTRPGRKPLGPGRKPSSWSEQAARRVAGERGRPRQAERLSGIHTADHPPQILHPVRLVLLEQLVEDVAQIRGRHGK